MKTILATAYAINPYKGSEDGMGWNFVLQIARFNRVIVVTRENNQATIEKFMQENPAEIYQNIQFLYFDLPYWMRFWKKGARGAMLYYWMWQKGIISFIKHQKLEFDIVHNLNFHNDWTPSYLWKLQKPFIWGPVGHHSPIPNEYLKPYSFKYQIEEKIKWWIKQLFWKFSDALQNTIQKASHIICMNSKVANHLNLQSNYSVIPSVATQDYGKCHQNQKDTFTLISVGRLVPLKGFDLTIQAFNQFVQSLSQEESQKCSLLIIGSGKEENLYKKMVQEYGLDKQVKFINWIDRTQLMEIYKSSSAFLFPSHEGAGMVVAEALSFGLPVICLKNEGPGEFINESCGFAITPTSYKETVQNLAKSILKIFKDKKIYASTSYQARNLFETKFHWNVRGEQLQKIYQSL
ncbi:MAG: glycosyltransferase [Raineya sp.]|jgi:glycosyltransferase involved in cell wall biosynthesis|nr:glycosyltransferase [Raineya sp.]